MSWLVLAQQQAQHATDAKGWIIVLIVGLVAVVLFFGFIIGRSDGGSVERVDDGRYWRARDSVNNLIDDAEREIRRKMWRNPRS
jgi:hypothetical protein